MRSSVSLREGEVRSAGMPIVTGPPLSARFRERSRSASFVVVAVRLVASAAGTIRTEGRVLGASEPPDRAASIELRFEWSGAEQWFGV